MYIKHWEFVTPSGSLIVSESTEPDKVIFEVTGCAALTEAQFKELAGLASYRYGSDYVRFQPEPEQKPLPLEISDA